MNTRRSGRSLMLVTAAALCAPAWSGCIGLLPFQNEPPRLHALNDVPPEPFNTYLRLPAVDGGVPFTLTVDAGDPERDGIRVWFPYVVGEMDFDPDGVSGVWTPPEGHFYSYELRIALEDDRDPPARSEYYVQFADDTSYGYYSDSGGSGSYGFQ